MGMGVIGMLVKNTLTVQLMETSFSSHQVVESLIYAWTQALTFLKNLDKSAMTILGTGVGDAENGM